MRSVSWVILSSGLLLSSAHAAEISLNLSGVAFEGGPAYEVSLGDAVVGSGTVDPVTPEGTVVRLQVPDEIAATNGDLKVRFTNDRFDGPDKDRSLYILGGSVNATSLGPASFHLISQSSGTPIERDASQWVQLWTGDDVAVASAPAGGWLGGVPAPAQASAAGCGGPFSVTGYPVGEIALAADQQGQLDPVLASAASGQCAIVVTGYSSSGGPKPLNEQVARDRAQAVLDQLYARGGKFTNATIASGGATTQFGPGAKDNRRVEIVLSGQQAPAQLSQGPLADAQGAGVTDMVVIGKRPDGSLFVSGAPNDPKAMLWLLEKAKADLLANYGL